MRRRLRKASFFGDAPLIVTAKVVWYDDRYAEENIEIRVNGVVAHDMHYGGQQAGWCHLHNSFDCILTPEEQKAVNYAT